MNNPHGYTLDVHGQPQCPTCGESTNASYLRVPQMFCWSCGNDMHGPAKSLNDRFIDHARRIADMERFLEDMGYAHLPYPSERVAAGVQHSAAAAGG